MVKLLIAIVISIVFVKATTFGWRPSRQRSFHLSPQETETANRFRKIVSDLAQNIGVRNYATYANLNEAAEYITREFEELGYESRSMSYSIGNQLFENIIVEKKAQHETDEVVIIAAHYDSCFNPGANDNASGVAGILELARLFRDEDLNKNVRFIAFTNEEPPFFMTENMGSRVYARKAKEQGENIKAAVILETIGYYSQKAHSQKYLPLLGPFYPNRADFIVVVGNFPSRRIVSRITSYFKKASDFPVEGLVAPGFIPGVNFSDHWSFWKEGFPAVMITDTAFLRSQHYHQGTDLPGTLDYERMAVMVHGLGKAIVAFVNN